MAPAWPIHVSRTPVPAPVPEPASPKDHGVSANRGGASSFGDAPVTTSCPHCHKAITTTISYRHSCVGVTICLLTALLLGWYAFCLVPFLWLGLKDAVHTCPSCRNLIHRHSRIHIPVSSLRDEVVTVKCGSCAVVLSRRYFLLFSVILFLILLFYVLRAGWLGSALDVIPKGPLIASSWRDFYQECGQRSQLGNPLSAAGNFREHFLGKTVKWEGLVKQVKEGTFSSNFLFLAMYPTMTNEGRGNVDSRSAGSLGSAGRGNSSLASLLFGDEGEEGGEMGDKGTGRGKGDGEQAGQRQEEEADLLSLDEENRGMQGDGADLALAFSEDLNGKVAQLVPGDKVAFEATLVELGRRQVIQSAFVRGVRLKDWVFARLYFSLSRGRPSLGRLWAVAVVETWEDRKKRLREKAEEESNFFQHLFPSFASPFGGFSPLSLMGSLGGRGVIVVRRRIITSDSPSPFSSVGPVWQSAGSLENDAGEGVVRVVSMAGTAGRSGEAHEGAETHNRKPTGSEGAAASEAAPGETGSNPGEGSFAMKLAQRAPTLFGGLVDASAGQDAQPWETLLQQLREKTEGKDSGGGVFASLHLDGEEDDLDHLQNDADSDLAKRLDSDTIWRGAWDEDHDIDVEEGFKHETPGAAPEETKPTQASKTPEAKTPQGKVFSVGKPQTQEAARGGQTKGVGKAEKVGKKPETRAASRGEASGQKAKRGAKTNQNAQTRNTGKPHSKKRAPPSSPPSPVPPPARQAAPSREAPSEKGPKEQEKAHGQQPASARSEGEAEAGRGVSLPPSS
ncbi:conserved hypothetical protein [Neospora caninum Liverpool]|uniref:LITAF domain-containing protein n=1 Tax=Neospora caninum (strain Liverpool) TaxID=572307 RepID=F0VQ99_NEOCL|nr:conserved hypothetical protein [Neospora caninum Liverpool]CBZ55896.1 conserved hypothetical protein [Neospora caninum Liverpool]CEL70639.1 TPA: hypothetical protein BN1204_063220 [Neospora caninum Liverpool]|eukprot:XP_003885922.1 conserved hypothetical protein [Neospora caninum Liverpool]